MKPLINEIMYENEYLEWRIAMEITVLVLVPRLQLMCLSGPRQPSHWRPPSVAVLIPHGLYKMSIQS